LDAVEAGLPRLPDARQASFTATQTTHFLLERLSSTHSQVKKEEKNA
jgi:hypothetical protein